MSGLEAVGTAQPTVTCWEQLKESTNQNPWTLFVSAVALAALAAGVTLLIEAASVIAVTVSFGIAGAAILTIGAFVVYKKLSQKNVQNEEKKQEAEPVHIEPKTDSKQKANAEPAPASEAVDEGQQPGAPVRADAQPQTAAPPTNTPASTSQSVAQPLSSLPPSQGGSTVAAKAADSDTDEEEYETDDDEEDETEVVHTTQSATAAGATAAAGVVADQSANASAAAAGGHDDNGKGLGLNRPLEDPPAADLALNGHLPPASPDETESTGDKTQKVKGKSYRTDPYFDSLMEIQSIFYHTVTLLPKMALDAVDSQFPQIREPAIKLLQNGGELLERGLTYTFKGLDVFNHSVREIKDTIMTAPTVEALAAEVLRVTGSAAVGGVLGWGTWVLGKPALAGIGSAASTMLNAFSFKRRLPQPIFPPPFTPPAPPGGLPSLFPQKVQPVCPLPTPVSNPYAGNYKDVLEHWQHLRDCPILPADLRCYDLELQKFIRA